MSPSRMPLSSGSIIAIAGLYAFIGGAASFFGWVFDAQRLADWFNSGIAIQPNTAVLLWICGLALLLWSTNFRRVVLVLAGFVALMGILTLVQHLFRVDLGFDQLFIFDRAWGHNSVTSPGRMGPPAAVSLSLIGLGLLILSTRKPLGQRLVRRVPLLGLAVAAIMLFSIAGYIFDARNFYALPWLTAISLQTALMLLAVAFGLIAAVPDCEPMLTLRDKSRTAVWARIVLPILIGLPMLLSSLRVIGESWGLYDTGTGRALVSVIEIIVTVALMWWTLTKLRQREADERTSNRRFMEVISSITDGLVTVDQHWRYTLVNEEMLKRRGKANDEMIGQDFWTLMADSIESKDQDSLRLAMTDRIDVEFEYLDKRNQCWYRDKAYPTADGGLAIYSQDITQHKSQEAALRDSERRARTLLDVLPGGAAFVVDRDLRYVLAGGEAMVNAGIPPQNLLGKTIFEALPEPLAKEYEPQIRRALAGQSFSVEHDAHGFSFLTRGVPLYDDQGEIDGVLAFSHDITNLKNAERLIRSRAQQFEMLVSQAPLGVFLIDADFKLAQVNPVAEPVFGDFPGGILGRDFAEVIAVLFDKEIADEIVSLFRHTLETGEPYVAPERALLRRDRGVVEYYDWRINRMLLPDERFGVVCYFHDISQQVQTRETIATSESRLRLITDAMPALISYVDKNGCYQFNNKRYKEWFGYDADSLVGKHIREVLGEEAFERVRPNVEAALRGERLEFEGEVPYLNAGTRRIHAEYVPDVLPDGAVAGYYALIIDTTQRKIAEDSLIKRNRQLSLLAGTSQELVFGNKSESEMLQAVFDKTLEAIDMEIFFNFIVDDTGMLQLMASSGLSEDQANCFKTISVGQYLCGKVAQQREPVVIEFLRECDLAEARLLREAGARCYVGIPLVVRDQLLGTIAFATCKRDQLFEGELSLLQTVCDQVAATLERGRLIENLRQSEERSRLLVSVLSASEERMQLAMTLADAGTWDHDLVTGKLHWSESHFRLLGYEPTEDYEATSDMWQNAVPAEDNKQLQREFERAKQARDLFHAEHRIRRLDGEVIWVKTAGRFFYDRYGNPVRFIGVFFDVTAAKHAEQALLDADRRKDEFLATLAHELRNPLAPLRNGVHILKMTQAASDAHQGLVEMMERQVDHMVRLVDDLLEVSRITRGKIELRKEMVDVGTIVRSAIEIAASGIEAARHQLMVNIEPSSIAIDADPVRVAQVLSNLLNNAVKYTEEGGKIWVTARVDQGWVILSVKDSGMGIPAEMLPKVFDLFTQIDRTLGRAQGGLGIGLALVKNLVELHSGSVDVKSDGPGLGSEFIVRLPSLPVRTGSLSNDDLADSQALPPSAKQRILVVDDNRDAANTLAILLRVLGAEVSTAYDGNSAIKAMTADIPDIVFLDIGMPGMDGYEVASEVRSRAEWRDVKLVALTGWGQEEDRRRTRDAGFDQHLTKPPDVAAVKAAIARTPVS
jgi:PAS domain S-box-containing protein